MYMFEASTFYFSDGRTHFPKNCFEVLRFQNIRVLEIDLGFDLYSQNVDAENKGVGVKNNGR